MDSRNNHVSNSRRQTSRPAATHARTGASRRPAARPAAPARRASERQQSVLRKLLIPILAVEVILLVLLLSHCQPHSEPVAPASNPSAAPSATPVPTATVSATAATAEPTQFVPAVTETPSFDEVSVNLSAKTQLLPVYTEQTTKDKMIAITIDDCFQMANLDKILDYAEAYKGKITVFPAGRVLSTDYSRQVLRRVYQLGFEIENHTFEHSRVYGVTDQEMASNIYRQNLAVNEALDLDYEMHFFRFFGGNGEFDPRVHQYLSKLGYLGVADWTYSGSDATITQIKKHLAPGAIFLFHTTNSDLKKLKEFIPYAVGQGYTLVTLNELLGFESNRVSPRTTSLSDTPIPSPDPYLYDTYQTLKSGDKSYLVQLVQERLAALNYLASAADADGDYGGKTIAAIGNFQALAGLPVDGVASVETQTRLFAEDAPYNDVYAHPTAAPAATEAPKDAEGSADEPAFF